MYTGISNDVFQAIWSIFRNFDFFYLGCKKIYHKMFQIKHLYPINYLGKDIENIGTILQPKNEFTGN